MCIVIAPAVAAGISLASAVIGTGISAYGAMQGAKAEQKAANTQAKIAANNQKVADWQAQDAIRRGGEKDVESRRLYAQHRGKQRAALAGKGIDIGEGSAFDMIEDTNILESVDSQRIRDNAQREAWGFRFQGQNYGAQSSIHRASASGHSPLLAGGGTLLTGASDVASRWFQWQQMSANGGS